MDANLPRGNTRRVGVAVSANKQCSTDYLLRNTPFEEP